MTRRIPVLAVWLVVAALAAPAAAAELDFRDSVTTLELDRELDARGNLGGMAVDRLGFLYVANFRDKLWRVGPEGEVVELSDALYGASGIAVDSRGRVYQANFLGNTIVRVERDGTAELFVADGLAGPVGLAFGADDTLYVNNCNGNYLSKVAPDGTVERFAESDRFACPNGIVVGGDGRLYVTNFNNLEILAVSVEGESAGTVESFATLTTGAGNAHIAFAKGNFYVTKIISNRVLRVAPDGTATPIAGTGQAGHGDGPALEAGLYRPNGIVASASGDELYVNTMTGAYSRPEPSTLQIRRIDLQSLNKILRRALAEASLERAVELYHAYKADPERGAENTVAEMITLGYNHLSERNVPVATTLFELNAASYPGVPAAQYHLGEAYRYVGRTAEAIAQYEKVLAIDPEHALAASRLAQLR